MRRSPLELCLAIISALALLPRADALIVRDYDADIHKRLSNFPKLVYHVTPTPNPDFIANASLFRGIGWPEDSREWTRQIALISPRHLIYATHYKLNPDWQIIFAGTDGKQHLHRIQSQTPVIGADGKTTDLMVVTLSNAVDTTVGITPFPVLNLPTDSDFVGKSLLVCGSFVDSGTGEIGGYGSISEAGLETTRFLYFDYDTAQGGPNDCRYYFGDSGSPSFVMIGGRPAIVGTCSSADDLTPDDGIDGPVYRNYLTSLHSYLNEVDAIMERQGHHLKRFYPASTKVSTEIAAGPSLRQSKPGSATVTTANQGSAGAHNVEIRLTFTHAPSSVSGAGWVCNRLTPLVWKCRRGGLPKASSATLTANWKKLPTTSKLKISTQQVYDGAKSITTTAALPLAAK